ncbi:hypothetical protein SBA1_870025 [Candidatus Sulfotelmatobacter kueseliae]|uniref:Uncharacterized protein n=1 Tax=Candidatus Sulfotelmatobacter kueseliae TaxID=2042962 RepID=A0A2U3L9N3_9BACT|nr:hypothetical protein SBA1_870025 [Candidatus Sulfotelmatobacter kueseliae]
MWFAEPSIVMASGTAKEWANPGSFLVPQLYAEIRERSSQQKEKLKAGTPDASKARGSDQTGWFIINNSPFSLGVTRR